MKPTPDSPALTAFALGELAPSESAAVAAALELDPVLAQESAELSGLADFLGGVLGGDRYSLGRDRHEEIFKAGHRPDGKVLVLDHKRRSRKQSFLAVASVAAVVALGFVGLSNFGVKGPGSAAGGSDVAGTAAGDPAPDSQITPEIPEGNPTVDSGLALPAMVERALARDGKLPAREAFEVAEWINLARSSSPPQVVVGAVSAYTEIGPCPWNPERSLLLVNLHAAENAKVKLQADLDLDPARVKSARRIGATSDGLHPLDEETLTGSQSVLYEIDLLPGETTIGSLDLELAGKDNSPLSGYLPIASTPFPEDAVSNDFKTARTLAAFARWGAGETRDVNQLTRIAASARDLLTEIRDEKVRYALDSILLAEEFLTR